MSDIFSQFVFQCLCLAPVFVVVMVLRSKRDQVRARSAAPFKELSRRPAGESLRLKIAAYDEQIMDAAFLAVGLPTVLGITGYMMRQQGLILQTGFVVISVIWACIWVPRLYRLSGERANHVLGFDGERFVGEELNRLMADGFEVFHDLQFDGFNMDHVLVGRPGVFLVETKTRRKPVSVAGTKDYRVEFDGLKLHWPKVSDAYGVEQAANNARTLSQWLTGAVGEPVAVMPILTLPGWMVDRKAPNRSIHVVNPKEIAKVCVGRGPELSENLFKRVCYQLEQRSRVAVE